MHRTPATREDEREYPAHDRHHDYAQDHHRAGIVCEGEVMLGTIMLMGVLSAQTSELTQETFSS